MPAASFGVDDRRRDSGHAMRERRIVPQQRALVLGDTSSRSSCRGTPPCRTATTKPCANPGGTHSIRWFSRRERDADRTAERRRAPAQIDDDVEDLAGDDAHELALRVLDLVVQSAQHAAPRARVVVLHERRRRCPRPRTRARSSFRRRSRGRRGRPRGSITLDVGRARSPRPSSEPHVRLAQEREQVLAVAVLRHRLRRDARPRAASM